MERGRERDEVEKVENQIETRSSKRLTDKEVTTKHKQIKAGDYLHPHTMATLSGPEKTRDDVAEFFDRDFNLNPKSGKFVTGLHF